MSLDIVKSPSHHHPQCDDNGRPVLILQVRGPTKISSLSDPRTTACIIPEGVMPARLNAIAVSTWQGVPTASDWEAHAAMDPIEEPSLEALDGYKSAAGGDVSAAG